MEQKATEAKFNNVLQDGLDFHKEKLTIMLKPGHYDIVYTKKYITEHWIIMEYDKEWENLFNERKSWRIYIM